MEEEQEGINLETVNLGLDDSITLPNVAEDENENNTQNSGTNLNSTHNNINNNSSDNNDNNNNADNTTNTTNATTIDEEKESLKKGINAERRARKEAEKKAKELEARILALENANKIPEKTTLDELIESGIDESVAKSIADAIDKKQSSSAKIEQELADMKFKNELLEKSKDSNFSDIMECKDEVKELVNKGLTIEQAYYAINYDKAKLNSKSEITRQVEAKLQNNQTRKEIFGNINSNVGTVANEKASKPKATAEEIAISKMAGIDINDYLIAKNANSIKQYDAYMNKKLK